MLAPAKSLIDIEIKSNFCMTDKCVVSRLLYLSCSTGKFSSTSSNSHGVRSLSVDDFTLGKFPLQGTFS